MARDETARRRVSGPIVRWLSGLLASVAMVAAVSGLVALLDPRVPPLYLLALYALGVVAIAMVWDTGLAVVNAVLAVTVFDYLFIPPLHTLGVEDMADVVALVVFLATAIVVGVPASRLRRAVLESERLSKELAASRARVIAAGDEVRRRVERDLHDGAQQHLISLAFELRIAQDTVPVELPTLRADLGQVAEELTEVMEELREISRGLHPTILSEGGLGPALRTLTQRSAVPVELHLNINSRYPQPVEVAAYYVVCEALTNATKHADASRTEVVLEERDSTLRLRVCDDGIGGAEPQRGSGLIGLRDRVEALGGSIDVTSPVSQGTVIQVSLPIERKDGDLPSSSRRSPNRAAAGGTTRAT
jgi:signal transduction histidine kinase